MEPADTKLDQTFPLFFFVEPFNHELLEQRLIPYASLRRERLDAPKHVLIEAHCDGFRARAWKLVLRNRGQRVPKLISELVSLPETMLLVL